jgi:hypothetical protein
LNPAGGGEGGDGEIGVEGAGAKAERVGAGDDRTLSEAIERFHAIVERQAIQGGDSQELAVANGCLFVGRQKRGSGGSFGLESDGGVFAGIITLALVGIVTDEKNAFAGFELAVRVLHENGAGDGRAAGHVAVNRTVFEDDGGKTVALGNREGGIGVDLQDDAAGEKKADAAAVGGDALVVVEKGLEAAVAKGCGVADGGFAEGGGDPADGQTLIGTLVGLALRRRRRICLGDHRGKENRRRTQRESDR